MTELLQFLRSGDAGGKTKTGTPCQSSLGLGATGLCLSHDPDRQAIAREVRASGGRATGEARRAARIKLPGNVPRAPKTIEDAERFASWLTHAVCVGEIDARTAHEAAVCLREFRGASEKRVLEAELKALRAELAAARSEGMRSPSRLARG